MLAECPFPPDHAVMRALIDLSFVRVAAHPCKSLSREKTTLPTRATEERAKSIMQNSAASHVCLSACWLLPSAEPDIHSLSRAPKGLHRRLSLCSLPVPKQSEGSLWSLIFVAQSANLRDLAACALCNPVVLSERPKPPCCGLPKSKLRFSRTRTVLIGRKVAKPWIESDRLGLEVKGTIGRIRQLDGADA